MKKIVKKTTVSKQYSKNKSLVTIIPAQIRDAMWIEAKDVLIWELINENGKMTLYVKKEE